MVSVTSSGVERWRTFFGLSPQDVTPLALTSTGAVLVGTTGGQVRALGTNDGSLRWEAELGMPLLLPPVVFPDGGSAWVGSSGRMSVLDAAGVVTATFWPGAEVTAAPSASSDGIVYLADREGTLHAVTRDGTELWAIGLGGVDRVALTTTPIQIENWIYVGRADGTLVAVVQRETGGVLPAAGILRVEKPPGAAGVLVDWSAVMPSQVPGGHPHLRRWDGKLVGPGTQLLSESAPTRTLLDGGGPSALAFYRLLTADSGENESRDR